MLSIKLVLMWLRKNWLPLLMCAIMFTGYKYHQHLVKESYEVGYETAKTDDANIAEKREKEFLKQRLSDKDALERKQLGELALRDDRIRELDQSSVGLRTELSRIRQLANHYTGSQSSGNSAREAVDLLAELLGESQDAYRRAAAEADRYYLAGMTCQLQYNSLRGDHETQTTQSGGKAYVQHDDK